MATSVTTVCCAAAGSSPSPSGPAHHSVPCGGVFYEANGYMIDGARFADLPDGPTPYLNPPTLRRCRCPRLVPSEGRVRCPAEDRSGQRWLLPAWLPLFRGLPVGLESQLPGSTPTPARRHPAPYVDTAKTCRLASAGFNTTASTSQAHGRRTARRRLGLATQLPPGVGRRLGSRLGAARCTERR